MWERQIIAYGKSWLDDLITDDEEKEPEEELKDIVTRYFEEMIMADSISYWDDALDTVRGQTDLESSFYLTEGGNSRYKKEKDNGKCGSSNQPALHWDRCAPSVHRQNACPGNSPGRRFRSQLQAALRCAALCIWREQGKKLSY